MGSTSPSPKTCSVAAAEGSPKPALAIYLAGANNYVGPTIVSGGTLTVAADNNLGASNSAVTINNATLQATGTFTTARPVTLGSAASTIDVTGANTLTLTSAMSGAGGLTKGPGTGTLKLAQAGGVTLPNFTVNGGAVNIGGAGGAVAPLVVSNALVVNGNATVNLLAGPTRIIDSISAITLSGNANVDIGNHEVVTATSATVVRSYLLNAYALTRDWSGRGVTSSLASANPGQYSVAYADGNDASAVVEGIPVAPNNVLVATVLTGDVNMDGIVNFADIAQILSYKYNTGLPASYTDGDLNYDGVVNFDDIALALSANYNLGQTFGLSPDGLLGAVPEPTGLALVGLAMVGLMARKRRARSQAPPRGSTIAK